MRNDYYILRDGQPVGPYTYEEMLQQNLEVDTQVSAGDEGEWQDASDLPEFFEHFESRGYYFPTEDNQGGFGWRLLAYIADSFILSYPISFFRPDDFNNVYKRMLDNTPDDGDMMLMLQFYLVNFVVVTLYHAICEASPLQGSLGKKMFRLLVVDADGRKLNIGRALLRNAGKFVSGAAFLIGYLSVLWNPYKQAWHDKWSKSFVLIRNR